MYRTACVMSGLFLIVSLWIGVSSGFGEETHVDLVKGNAAGSAKDAGAELVRPVLTPQARWEYLVERTTTTREGAKTTTVVDRALVYFGAAAKDAGGQIKAVPNVVYIDPNQKPLSSTDPAHGAPFTTIGSGVLKLTRLEDLFESEQTDARTGQDPNLPLQLAVLPNSFFLPLEPKAPLQDGLTWARTLYVRNWGGLTFPVTITHKLKGYENRTGRRCAVVEYTVAGKWDVTDHPELFTEQSQPEVKAGMRVKGTGQAWVHAGVIVDKQQTIGWRSFEEHLSRLEDGSTRWVPAVDQEYSVSVQIALQHDDPKAWGRLQSQSESQKPSLPVRNRQPLLTYVLIAAGVIVAGFVIWRKKAGKSLK